MSLESAQVFIEPMNSLYFNNVLIDFDEMCGYLMAKGAISNKQAINENITNVDSILIGDSAL
jgi:hypothetical protein